MSVQTEPLTRTYTANAVSKVLDAYCKKQTQKATLQDESYGRLWKVMDAYLQQGGKRIRPYLVLVGYEAYGGTDRKNVLPVAAAWELLHACLLIHDDIIDRDITRHNAPNVAGMYEAFYKKFGADTKHYAASVAMLSGDLLLSGAHQLVVESAISAEDKLLACNYLNQALFSVGGGELLDVEMVLETIQDAKPEKVARYKTAQYSFEYPLLCGAALAGAPSVEHKKLQDFGASIGVAFQLTDDILGVFGDKKTTGKSTDSDIRDKKRTLLVQEAIKRLSEQDALYVETLYAHNYVMADAEIENIRNFIEQSGARQAVQTVVNRLAENASRTVDTMNIPRESQEQLRNLVLAAVRRAA